MGTSCASEDREKNDIEKYYSKKNTESAGGTRFFLGQL